MFSPKGRAQTAKQHTTNPPHSSYVPLIQIDPFSEETKSIFSHFSFSCSQSCVHTLAATDEQSEETEDGPNHFQQVLMDSGQCSKWVERTLDAGSPSPRVSVAGAHELAHYSLAHCLPQKGSVEELWAAASMQYFFKCAEPAQPTSSSASRQVETNAHHQFSHSIDYSEASRKQWSPEV